ncbi:phage fiber-tail adaptor protein [Entomobacter blattae]|uniref:Uncharacterized protein n=1 Tax=Entomobacter blattae TaxID=2762277 RepID=A0A7H1NU27_9PROT|nr:hypothetical protein [Entomobacter blattae]QNT79287.1 hypothetical protein JGUZn3_20840 [Entomobacter blattae]
MANPLAPLRQNKQPIDYYEEQANAVICPPLRPPMPKPPVDVAPGDWFVVPSGPLCHQVMLLNCKGPGESRRYWIDFHNQLAKDDEIVAIGAEAGDPKLVLSEFVADPDNRGAFYVTISGGTLNMRSGIRFRLTLETGEVREVVLQSLVMDQGLISGPNCPPVSLGRGIRGTQIWIVDKDPDASYVPPSGFAPLIYDMVINETTNGLWQYQPVAGSRQNIWKFIIPLGGPRGEPGKSAYQSWLDTGHTGSEAEFVASLKGEKGDSVDSTLFKKMFEDFMAGLPLTDPGDGVSLWNNGNIPTISVRQDEEQ